MTQLTTTEHELAAAEAAYSGAWLEAFEAAGRRVPREVKDGVAYCIALADEATRDQGVVLDRLRARQLAKEEIPT